MTDLGEVSSKYDLVLLGTVRKTTHFYDCLNNFNDFCT